MIVIVIVLIVAYQKIAHRVTLKGPGGAGGMDDVLGKVLGSSYREGKLNRQIAGVSTPPTCANRPISAGSRKVR